MLKMTINTNEFFIFVLVSICSIDVILSTGDELFELNPHSGLRKGVYSLIEVISNEPNK
jgi:hypothetical protein